MRVSKHAKERSKQRNGWNEKTTERMVQKVLEKGIPHRQTKGRLNKWINGLYFKNRDANNICLYGDKAYIFHNEVLITVLQIPANLTKDMDKFIRKESEGSEDNSD